MSEMCPRSQAKKWLRFKQKQSHFRAHTLNHSPSLHAGEWVGQSAQEDRAREYADPARLGRSPGDGGEENHTFISSSLACLHPHDTDFLCLADPTTKSSSLSQVDRSGLRVIHLANWKNKKQTTFHLKNFHGFVL